MMHDRLKIEEIPFAIGFSRQMNGVGELDIISDLQQNYQKLLDKNHELQNKIDDLLSQNLNLVQQVAKTKSLQEQLDRILKEEPIFIQQDHPDDLLIETLQNRINELTKEKDEYAQDASVSKMYQNLVKQKDEQIKYLTQQLCDAKAEAQYANQLISSKNPAQNPDLNDEEDQVHSLTALRACIAEYSRQNSELNRSNIELQTRNATLSSEIAHHEMQIKVLKQENDILSQATSTSNFTSSKHEIQHHIEELSQNIFRNSERKLSELETRIHHLEQKLASFSNVNNPELIELQEQNTELQEQLDYYMENDRTAELAFALSQLEQYKLENESLKARLQKRL